MTFETTAAGNKNGSTRPKGTNCLSLHDRTSLPVFFVGQYTGKCGRLQYGIFNKNRRAVGGGLHVSAMANKNADAGLGVLRAKWRRTFQPRFRMRRRRGVIRRAVTAAPRARPRKLHILRSAASGRTHTFRCSSSPNCNRCAGLQFGSSPSCGKRYGRKGRWGCEIALTRSKGILLLRAIHRWPVPQGTPFGRP